MRCPKCGHQLMTHRLLSSLGHLIEDILHILPWHEMVEIHKQNPTAVWWLELQHLVTQAEHLLPKIWGSTSQHYGLDYEPDYKEHTPTMFKAKRYFEDRRGGVYFVQAANGHVKIGKSNDIWRRSRAIESQNAIGAWLAAFIVTDDNGEILERQLHRRFEAERIHHEWFYPTAELVQLMLESGGSIGEGYEM